MKIPSRTVTAALDRAARLPDGIPPPAKFDYANDRSRDIRPAAVARRAAFLSLGGARPSETELAGILAELKAHKLKLGSKLVPPDVLSRIEELRRIA